MRISRKYPLFLLLTTIGTSGAIFFTLLGVLRSSLEREITKRGESTAESFARANSPTVLTFMSEKEKSSIQLQYNLNALGENPDVLDARVADHRGTVIASLSQSEVGTVLPAYFTAPDRPNVFVDPINHAYHFAAEIRFREVTLGTFVLSLSRVPLETALVRARNSAFFFVGGIAAVMSIFALLLVRREVRPLKVMSVTLGAIAKGDFTLRVPEERPDEIGDLGAAFNRMVARADLFFHYVDKMIIERLVADASLAKPGGRERELAVLFGDMRGYTAMSNRRTADEVVRIVNTYFHLFIECIAQFRGVVDKTMGDAIMSVFERGDDEGVEMHKRRGVLAAAYMKAASRVLNRFLRDKIAAGVQLGLEPREFGFAIATGQAIVGNIGSKRRMDYTVCGRVVNLASRLEGLTKNGEVILDNFTRLGTDDLATFEPLAPVQPKGFTEAEKVTPHRLLAITIEEEHRMRIFLKKLFAYSFAHDLLMPESLPVGQQQPWCQEAEVALIKIISEMPSSHFFARVDIESGDLIPERSRRTTIELPLV